jgi:hypothetical protein
LIYLFFYELLLLPLDDDDKRNATKMATAAIAVAPAATGIHSGTFSFAHDVTDDGNNDNSLSVALPPPPSFLSDASADSSNFIRLLSLCAIVTMGLACPDDDGVDLAVEVAVVEVVAAAASGTVDPDLRTGCYFYFNSEG